jgi:hypothetical protein
MVISSPAWRPARATRRQQEIAEYQRVSPRTVERWTGGGTLTPSRMSAHTVRYLRGDLAAFVTARQHPAA